MPLLDDSEWKPIGNPVAIPRQPSGILRRVVGDTALDLGKGAIQFGQSAVGLADLATAGLAGDALKYIGYDPDGTQQWMDQYYSTQRQEAEQEVGQADGFLGKMGALASNPSALVGRGIQSAPMLLGSMGAANRVYQATNSLKAATAAGHIAEGAMTAGSVAQDIRNQGGDRGDMYWAIPAGAATAAIGYGAGRLMPDAQIESMLIPGARGAVIDQTRRVPGGIQRFVSGDNLLARTGRAAFSEGVLEEMPQSAQEQMFTNVGTGKPLMYQVPEAAGEGLLVGGATGGVLGGFRRAAPPAPQNLLPGANTNPQTPPAPPLTPVAPRLDPNANYGETGTLFGGQPDLVDQPPAAPENQYDVLRSQVSQLVEMYQAAEAAGDGAQMEAINHALGQITSELTALSDNSLNQRNLFDTGIYEMVGDKPYELTGDQAAAGGLPTLEGDMEPVPQDTRLAEIRHALTQANGGKANAQLLRFIPEFRAALDQGADAVQAVISKYDTNRSTLNPGVLETAEQLANIYRTQDVNGMAANGVANAQPGVRVGQVPVSNATEMAMREQNQARDAQETVDVENMLQRDQDQQDTSSQLESLIPERQEKLSPGGQRRLFSNEEMGRVIPNAAPQGQPEAPVETGKSTQGKLFTTRGQPTKAAQRTAPDVKTQAPPAPAKPPRKSKVKAKVGDQEVELEVPDAEARMAEMQKDVSKFEAFVACLRRK